MAAMAVDILQVVGSLTAARTEHPEMTANPFTQFILVQALLFYRLAAVAAAGLSSHSALSRKQLSERKPAERASLWSTGKKVLCTSIYLIREKHCSGTHSRRKPRLSRHPRPSALRTGFCGKAPPRPGRRRGEGKLALRPGERDLLRAPGAEPPGTRSGAGGPRPHASRAGGGPGGGDRRPDGGH